LSGRLAGGRTLPARTSNRRRLMDLFTGQGGFVSGFVENHDFEIVAAYERDKSRGSVLKKRFGDIDIEFDVSKIVALPVRMFSFSLNMMLISSGSCCDARDQTGHAWLGIIIPHHLCIPGCGR